MLKLRSEAVYVVHRCSTSSRIPAAIVCQYFEPSQSRVQERALPFEDARHVGAERLDAGEHHRKENRNL